MDPGSSRPDRIPSEDGSCRDCIIDVFGPSGCDWSNDRKGEEISVKEALELMTQTLDSRLEVGLIAGWDNKTEHPVLCRVDNMGGLATGEILATGSRLQLLYDFLDLNCPNNVIKFGMDDESQMEKYTEWCRWSVNEAAKMALKGICYVASFVVLVY
ncbi:OLC1v1037819C1 [Oldenlandia corymbosa var. corymbosa]|uniref:OLC1v1037819C1 n=1 Tax=Oldenlandia corymbosa var. corymbosa TaxID=529605 RepID=A0AAV1CZU1_OLDCO|nr:OLC1v1037819C1 [Oldenlandia corymbosa var. corymbosa]